MENKQNIAQNKHASHWDKKQQLLFSDNQDVVRGPP